MRKFYRGIKPGFCSPNCASMAVVPEHRATEIASDILDDLYMEGYIDEAIASDPRKFADMVRVIQPHLL